MAVGAGVDTLTVGVATETAELGVWSCVVGADKGENTHQYHSFGNFFTVLTYHSFMQHLKAHYPIHCRNVSQNPSSRSLKIVSKMKLKQVVKEAGVKAKRTEQQKCSENAGNTRLLRHQP